LEKITSRRLVKSFYVIKILCLVVDKQVPMFGFPYLTMERTLVWSECRSGEVL
jgi:hypothetical protein